MAWEYRGSYCMQHFLHDLPSFLLPLQEIAAPICKTWSGVLLFYLQ